MSLDGFYIEFGRRLQEARRYGPRRLTQADLAAAVGLSRSSIANIEMGRQPVQLHVLVKMAEVIGVPPGDLIPPRLPAAKSKESRIAVEALQQQGASPAVLDRALAHLPPKGK